MVRPDHIATDENHLPALRDTASSAIRSNYIGSEGTAPARFVPLEDVAKQAAGAAFAKNTKAAYGSRLRAFAAFCSARGYDPLPAAPETVANFLAAYGAGEDRQGKARAASTVGQAAAAIRLAHLEAGHGDVTAARIVKNTLAGHVRTVGRMGKPKTPMVSDLVKDAARAIGEGDTIKAKRDRAIILLGFGGAFRRSELCAINVDDLKFTDEGLEVLLRRSKTDQAGQGQVVPVIRGGRHCPVEAVRSYIEAAALEGGPLFRRIRRGDHVQVEGMSGKAVAAIVKAGAVAAGEDGAKFAGHSLRSGFCTSAAENGAAIDQVQSVSRHKSASVLLGYVRRAERFKDHAGKGLL